MGIFKFVKGFAIKNASKNKKVGEGSYRCVVAGIYQGGISI